MKVLVTGASGGLGELVVERLLKDGHHVIAASRDEEKARQSLFWGRAEFRGFDISNYDQPDLFKFFGQPDALIHLAWEKLDNYRDPVHTDRLPSEHADFIKNLVQNGLQNVTCVGTCYEYGLLEGEAKETDPSAPVLPYPQGKEMLRRNVENICSNASVSWKWLRVFYVFGPVRFRRNLYTLLIEAIKRGDEVFNMSGGEQVRDFLTPQQIADIIVRTSLQIKVNGIINCCSGKPVVLKEMVQQFLKEQNSSMRLNLGYYPYADYEPMKTWGSVSKLQQALREK